MKYGIYAVPTIVINGSIEFVGRPDKESLVNAIKKEL
ncbi:MAG: thioredoxin family protein [Candidatus Hydrothermarchaeota archaeon]